MRRHRHHFLLATLTMVLCSAQAKEQTLPRLRSMHLRGETGQVVRQAFELYGVDVLFVNPIQGLSRTLRVDLTDADLAVTAEVLAAMSHCFFVPVNAHLMLVVQDDKAHRSQYERPFTETIVIPNLQAGNADQRSEVQGLLASVFGISKSTLKDNRVTIRATKRDMLQIEDTLTHLFEPPPQVLLEVRAYLVSRNRDRNAGIDPPQSITIFNVKSEAESLISSNSSVVQELIAAGVVSAGNYYAIALALIAEGYGSSSVLDSSFVTVGGGLTDFGLQFDSLAANLSLTQSTTQQLQSATLRLSNGEAGKFRVGSRYPIKVASTVPVGDASTHATPSIEYEDLGLTLEARPQLLAEDEVFLHLHETFRSLAGSTLNGIPELGNQEFVSDLSVPHGVTTVVVSYLSNSEARTVEGLATLVPSNKEMNQQSSALVVTVTPYLTRAKE